MKKVGILGGTFNPIHIGHLRLALECVELLGLDYVELMPCAKPAHKVESNLLPFEFRTSLISAAIEGNANDTVRLNMLEGFLSHPSYSYNSLSAWKDQNPDCHGTFILGAEDFSKINSWYKGFEVPSLMDFAIISRYNTTLSTFKKNINDYWNGLEYNEAENSVIMAENAKTYFLHTPILDISASLIRDKWLKSLNIRHLVPDNVLSLLESNRDLVYSYWSKQI